MYNSPLNDSTPTLERSECPDHFLYHEESCLTSLVAATSAFLFSAFLSCILFTYRSPRIDWMEKQFAHLTLANCIALIPRIYADQADCYLRLPCNCHPNESYHISDPTLNFFGSVWASVRLTYIGLTTCLVFTCCRCIFSSHITQTFMDRIHERLVKGSWYLGLLYFVALFMGDYNWCYLASWEVTVHEQKAVLLSYVITVVGLGLGALNIGTYETCILIDLFLQRDEDVIDWKHRHLLDLIPQTKVLVAFTSILAYLHPFGIYYSPLISNSLSSFVFLIMSVTVPLLIICCNRFVRHRLWKMLIWIWINMREYYQWLTPSKRRYDFRKSRTLEPPPNDARVAQLESTVRSLIYRVRVKMAGLSRDYFPSNAIPTVEDTIIQDNAVYTSILPD